MAKSNLEVEQMFIQKENDFASLVRSIVLFVTF